LEGGAERGGAKKQNNGGKNPRSKGKDKRLDDRRQHTPGNGANAFLVKRGRGKKGGVKTPNGQQKVKKKVRGGSMQA